MHCIVVEFYVRFDGFRYYSILPSAFMMIPGRRRFRGAPAIGCQAGLGLVSAQPPQKKHPASSPPPSTLCGHAAQGWHSCRRSPQFSPFTARRLCVSEGVWHVYSPNVYGDSMLVTPGVTRLTPSPSRAHLPQMSASGPILHPWPIFRRACCYGFVTCKPGPTTLPPALISIVARVG